MVRDSRLQAANDLPAEDPDDAEIAQLLDEGVPADLATHRYDADGYCTGCAGSVTWLACPAWAEYKTEQGLRRRSPAGKPKDAEERT